MASHESEKPYAVMTALFAVAAAAPGTSEALPGNEDAA
jgi:hypothetical protein